MIMSAFVNQFGQVYFLEMGVIRYVDSSGLVRTLAGQPRNSGVGSNPLSARFSQINHFAAANNDVYIGNTLENMLETFSLNGGNLAHVAGDSTTASAAHGSTALSAGLPSCGWSRSCAMMVDTTLNRLYRRGTAGKFSYIDLSTGLWSLGSSITTQLYSLTPHLEGYIGINPSGTLLAYIHGHYGATTGDSVTWRQFTSSGTGSVVYGVDTNVTGIINNSNYVDLCSGVNSTDSSCKLGSYNNGGQPDVQAKYDSTTSSWLVTSPGEAYINTLPLGGGVTNRSYTTANGIMAFDYRRDGATEYMYYCATNGKLYKRNVTAATETQLTLPSSTITCDGQAMHYHSGRDSLIFIYKQNGLYGIAEYQAP
jgi:hypothetical protein